MYSIYFIYKTNEEEQNATAYIHISLSQNVHPQARCTSSPIGEAGDHSAAVVCDQHIDLLIVLFMTSAVSNHTCGERVCYVVPTAGLQLA